MESTYLITIGSGIVLGAFLGRLITKLKLALVYESRLKERRANNMKAHG